MIPRIAIIDQNTLEATGLKSILCDMAPMADVSTFTSVEEMLQEDEYSDETVRFFHFFVSSQELISHADFFLQHQRQTIVLTAQPPTGKLLERFHCLSASLKEHDLIKAVLSLHQMGHGGHSHCRMRIAVNASIFSLPLIIGRICVFHPSRRETPKAGKRLH